MTVLSAKFLQELQPRHGGLHADAERIGGRNSLEQRAGVLERPAPRRAVR
jgi:hypothetical protein